MNQKSSTAALAGSAQSGAVERIGSVPFLNARPLIFGMEDRIQLAAPAQLARDLREGRLDAGLIPVAECLEHPGHQIAPGIAIASRGPVRSVYLAHRVPLGQLRRVALDPASKTSNLLLRIVLGGFYKLTPRYKPGTTTAACEGRLLIGDRALRSRSRLRREGWKLLDLGEVWFEKTGLPFVFAVWAVREGLDARPYRRLFTNARKRGLQCLDEIVAAQRILPAPMAREYFTRHVRYDFGPEEARGLREFQRLCVEHGLIARTAELKLGA